LKRTFSIRHGIGAGIAGALALTGLLATSAAAGATNSGFLGQFHHISTVASTVPYNGDVNPYGVQVVPTSLGKLYKGDILVSNFNNAANQQGTGRTIVEINPYTYKTTVFADIHLPYKAPVGLTTALEILPGGFVLVGNLPTDQGNLNAASAGSLIIVDRWGHVVENLTAPWINGPWDSFAQNYGDHGDNTSVYFTNVLNGTQAANGNVVYKGTIVRLDLDTDPGYLPKVLKSTVIASDLAERTDPDALVVGPTGVALNEYGGLYVADTVNSVIRVIPNANHRTATGGAGLLLTPVRGALNGPLGLLIAPNNNIITVNGGDGQAVEIAPNGYQVTTKYLDTSGSPPGAGALFGIALAPYGHGLYFVDDATNTLNLLH
jgi:hypothetical protein